MIVSTQELGKDVENLVKNYLQQHGLKFIAANYLCKYGEIDLIMVDHETLVFIEVRYRNNFKYGDGVATVDKNKRYKIKKTAVYYLQKHKLYDKVNCRFDVVAVTGIDKEKITWIKDAFWDKW